MPRGNPTLRVRAPQEQLDRWAEAAKAAEQTVAQWVRRGSKRKGDVWLRVAEEVYPEVSR